MELLRQVEAYNELWRETNALYEEWAKNHGISYYELLIIQELAGNDGVCCQKEICRKWQLPKQTVNSILKNFSKWGWVKMETSSADRRNKELSLTEEGRRRCGEIAGRLQMCERRVWERLGGAQTKALLEITRLYNQYFKEEGKHESETV